MARCDETYPAPGSDYEELRCELNAGHGGPHRVTEESRWRTIRRAVIEWTEEPDPEYVEPEASPFPFEIALPKVLQSALVAETLIERAWSKGVLDPGAVIRIPKIADLEKD